jgi:hypothetical protein
MSPAPTGEAEAPQAYPAPAYRSLLAASPSRQEPTRPRPPALATGRESLGGTRRPPLDEDQAAPGGPVDEVLEDVSALSDAVDGIDGVAHRAVDGVVERVDGVVGSVDRVVGSVDGVVGSVDGVVGSVDGVEISIHVPLLKAHSPKDPEEEP